MKPFPEHVVIRGLRWKVHRATRDELTPHGLEDHEHGVILPEQQSILIDKALPHEVAWSWLFHEARHAMNWKTEEDAVEWDAMSWFAFCVDNGLLD